MRPRRSSPLLLLSLVTLVAGLATGASIGRSAAPKAGVTATNATAALTAALPAMTVPKRALSHSDYDGWRSILSPTISPDGQTVAYAFMPLEGDGELVVRSIAAGTEFRLPIGALPPSPTASADHNPERPAPRREPSIAFSADGRWIIATRFPSDAERKAARRERKSIAEGLLVVDTQNQGLERIDAVRSYQLGGRSQGWLAVLTSAPGSSTKGADLQVWSLGVAGAKATRRFSGVSEYALTPDGETLVFATVAEGDRPAAVFRVAPGDPAAPQAILSGAKDYRRLTWDRRQQRLALIANEAEGNAASAASRVFVWEQKAGSARALALPAGPDPALGAAASGTAEGFTPSADHTPVFSFDGSHLLLMVRPAQSTPPPAAPADDEERVTADIWHWQDEFLQPMQAQRAPKDRVRGRAVRVEIDSGKIQVLGDFLPAQVTLSPDGRRAFVRDERPYRAQLDYEGPFHDLLVFAGTESKPTLVARRLNDWAASQWSPDGRWIAFHQDGHWHAFDAQSQQRVTLSAQLTVSVVNEDNDLPRAPLPHGAAGWSSDSTSLLVYDRFDLWQLFIDGRPPRSLTAGAGRSAETTLRLIAPAPRTAGAETLGVDVSQPLLLRGESERTRATGFFRTATQAGEVPVRLRWEDSLLTVAARAREADAILVTRARFDLFPDLHATDASFAAMTPLSRGDAQREPFRWGKAELRSYRSLHGETLPMAVFLPADFDPAKKYPLIVYLYERLSQTVNWFINPVPGTTINASYYTSNGYMVVMPDIAYRIGDPGASALACVLPAVDEVIRGGGVDADAIGIQGHSWGGYQTAFLVTQTTRFRAAAAGATVGNMTSAYAGISIGSGRSRQYKYESEQSRISRPLYEDPLAYLRNSPVFFADRVRTPLLLLHNDGDDTVPFSQGVELFLALRRAGQEVYLINYHGEFHGLRRRADQKDYARRMSQFFDHHLKGAPRPDWMERGVPFLEREAEKLRFPSSP
jgi:dipeptidyl aminopeptidase/acylaminoacyl peptidase